MAPPFSSPPPSSHNLSIPHDSPLTPCYLSLTLSCLAVQRTLSRACIYSRPISHHLLKRGSSHLCHCLVILLPHLVIIRYTAACFFQAVPKCTTVEFALDCSQLHGWGVRGERCSFPTAAADLQRGQTAKRRLNTNPASRVTLPSVGRARQGNVTLTWWRNRGSAKITFLKCLSAQINSTKTNGCVWLTQPRSLTHLVHCVFVPLWDPSWTSRWLVHYV